MGKGSGCVESINRQINTCRQIHLLVCFLEKPTFRVWFLYIYLVHGQNVEAIADYSGASV